MSTSAGSVSPVSINKASAVMSAQAMASSVINKLAALPQVSPATPVNGCEEPSAPNTPPTALHEAIAASQSTTTSASGPSQASSSSRSSSMALPFAADEGCSVFFARVPPTKQEGEILQVFQQYGPVHSINLYRRWAASKSSKGCGIVIFEAPASAEAAITALHNQFLWPDAAATMVVEKVDLAKLQCDTAEKRHHASRFLRASSYGSDVHTPASSASDRDTAAWSAAEAPAGPQYPPAPVRTASWPCGKQQQGRWPLQGGGSWQPPQRHWQQQQQQAEKKPKDGHLPQQHSACAADGGSSQVAPVWPAQGYTTPYPYYYGPNGMPYMMYPPGYYYPMTYPNNMQSQCVWVPYLPPGGSYTAPAGYPYSVAAGNVPAAVAPAVAGAAVVEPVWVTNSSSSSSSPADDRVSGQQVHGANGSSEQGAVDGKQQQLQQPGSGQYPRVADVGDQVLNAKQLTTCIKNCATTEAIHYLVQLHLKDMNHIHISAALGRLAVIAAAANHGQHHRPKHQQLVAQLIDHLVEQQLASAKPFELCNSLSAAARMGCRVPAVQVQQMLDAFIERLGLSKPNEVCTILSAAARMGQRVSDEEFRLMLAVAVGNLQECTAKKVQELLRAVSDVGYLVEADQLRRLRAAADESNCSEVIANSMSNLTVGSSSSNSS